MTDMIRQLRACLFLLAVTAAICCVAYPLALRLIGQALFADPAHGSLVNRSGQPALTEERAIGSRLIAQSFTDDAYFHPRPSAVAYDASASGASNWAASNYRLRERVAQALGPVVAYADPGVKAGQPVGPDVEAWLHDQPRQAAAWAQAHPDAPVRWLKANPGNARMVAAWKQQGGLGGEPAAEDVAPFFAATAARPRADWPDAFGLAVQAVFFESWLETHPGVALLSVPADAVTTSASGLDPHITVDNARWQLPRVAAARAAATRRPVAEVRRLIEEVVHSRTEAPLEGLAGVPLVNVLELNLDLDRRLEVAEPGR